MNKHARASMRIKLGLVFGFLLIILAAVGWLGLSRMSKINSDLASLFDRHWAKVQLAREIETYSNRNEQVANQIFFTGQPKDRNALIAARNKNSAVLDSLQKKLDERVESKEEIDLLRQMEEVRVPMHESLRQALDLLSQGKDEQARQLFVSEMFPQREKFDSLRDSFVQLQEAQMTDARYLSQSSYAAVRWLTILLMLLAIGAATTIAVVVTTQMAREVSHREQAEVAIRTLNESLESKVAERTAELAHAIQQLRYSEHNFRSMVENSPYGIFRVAPDHKILQANRALLDMLGYSSESEIVGIDTRTQLFCYVADQQRIVEQFRDQNEVKGIEGEWKRRDGTPFTVRYGRHTVTDGAGNVTHEEMIVEDITERRTLERQLRQAQKMEAVGRLAGGVAHDFNNLLGVIIGYSELLLDQPDASGVVRAQAEQIKKAGSRASSLTRQLLAFSRQQVLEAKVLSLDTVVAEMQKMLPRLIGEDIELRVSSDPELWHVKADQGQLEQVIMNLAVNARDAMPDGGGLSIETTNVVTDGVRASNQPGMEPGRYVLLTVRDTGMGMDAQTLAHIFEPFFTTKGHGRGTGLGLATVYGVIKQSGGYIWAESEPGRGSTFRVYLPSVDQPVPHDSPANAGAGLSSRSETILLVEDEESLRTLTRTMLEHAGYTILEAGDGNQAIELARQHHGPIDLLLTDVVMPGINGHIVAERLTTMLPQLQVVFMSGYTKYVPKGTADLKGNFLQKPFTRENLLCKLNEVLELRVARREPLGYVKIGPASG